ncbi:hypothetical protein ACWHAM_24980 [Paenibacillus terrae]
MSSLEQQKIELETKLIESQHVTEKAAITEESLRQLLSCFQDHNTSRKLLRSKSSSTAKYSSPLPNYSLHMDLLVIMVIMVFMLYIDQSTFQLFENMQAFRSDE